MAKLLKLIEKIIPLLRENSNNFVFYTGLGKIKSNGKCIVIGDIHGDLETLNRIFRKINLESFLEEKSNLIIFLGDYVDRGKYSLEVLEKLFDLKIKYPYQVLLLRGNHEISKYWDVYPSNLRLQLSEKFKEKSTSIFYNLIRLFDELPFAAYVENNFFFVHGGIPIDVVDLMEIAKGDVNTLIQLVWNDPFEGKGYLPSPRGIGYLFGIDITERFLKENNFNLIIRGHEPCMGFKFNHDNKVLTVFSSKVYGNSRAGYLVINLEEGTIKRSFV